MSRKEDKIICNRCGKIICTEDLMERTDFLTIEKTWGYFSNQDGKIQKADLCEACCRQLASEFVIPPEERNLTELL